jgi:hypothetical protein
MKMKQSDQVQILWPAGFDEQAQFELPYKGWLSVCAKLENGHRYPLYFIDPIRLQQELEDGVQAGKPYFAEPGLIILPEVTVEAIREAVQTLQNQDFFAYLQADAFQERGVVMEPQPA